MKFLENEDEQTHPDQEESNAILTGGNSEKNGKRRASLAQKMTSNLRRLSGAADLKIDITEPSPPSNPKFCNKKIKVRDI